MNKLKKKVAADKSDKTMQFISGFNLDEPMHFAGRTHRMIIFGLSIGANDEGLGDDDDLSPLEKIEK
eukprot:8475034-Heterocapsa_arctica.AAC.1